MKSIMKISKFGKVTAKGNQAIGVSLTRGFAVQPGLLYILSTPEAIEQAGLKEGQDITDLVAGFRVETSTTVDESTGEVSTFKWLVPPTE